MHDDNLPTPAGGENDDRRAPVPRDHAQLPAHAGSRELALEFDAKPAADDEIDLLAYWRMLVKRRWLVLGVLGSVVALALLITLMTPPVYRATATLQIDRESVQAMFVEGVNNGEASTPDFLTTQYELLKSRALAERVANELRIDSATVDRLGSSSWLQRAKDSLRQKPAAPEGGVDAPVDAEAENTAATGSLPQAVAVVRDGLVVEPIRNSRLVRIHFDSTLPAFSARVVNALADGFIASSIERKFDASSYAGRYLEEQLALAKGRLEESERALVSFATKENLFSGGEGNVSLEGQNLSTLNTALAAAQDQRIQAQAMWNQVSGGGSLPSAAMGASIVNVLQQQRAQLTGQYQQQLQTYKPEYPTMLALKQQIDEVERQIREERASVRDSIRAEYDAARTRESMLVAQLNTLRTQALDVDNRSIDYNILRREVDTNRQLYDGLLQRYKEIGVAGGVSSNNISIVDRANVPTSRFKPNLPLNLAIGLTLGLILGVLLAFVLEFLDDTLKTPEDLEQHLRLAVLGVVPHLRKQSIEAAIADQRSAFSESYRSVRTALQFSTDRGVPKVLLVTSPSAAEGKSTTALTLARNFAQLGKRVLLIEADLRNPSLHRAIGVRAEMGLSSLLSGAANIQQVIMETDDDRLNVVLAGPLPPNPAELLAGSRLLSMLSVAGEKYDQVIIDGPPVLGIADAPILSSLVSGTLLVTKSGKTRIKTAQIALKRLSAARARVIGGLLTHYNANAAGYGYDYESYYSYGTTPKLGKD
ncbi:polysaccharide biosynthesis tyrosine autokinase [Luteimonas fraxinea]|uniref:non-specific protein-tyrosine kinase n=1 Tax=Luteimonas fraxinea TaxID=2901869 RepID=A0ABS8UG93_9GAMM|nr:polysaccharide biosynthesis tyrosine autokinase [Luteimonas fraxinea]MCD9097683.1 polysaccharide biosynthesis tyrosine autokinase [Luteimonas fraxinea]MCD9124775.1 polysaccharide biosynthesis tyrosine autokinase [Luteimonas fraxinea]UHH08582.1 polysaccharide biosynthesis tyrosine autokinase [Luteimonas fraxinea]